MSKTNAALILIIVAILGFFLLKDKDFSPGSGGIPSETVNETNKITYFRASPDMIVVELPFPGAVTGKEFSVVGRARGQWFFEASFPMELRDKDGNVIAVGYSQAQGEWMTEEFVPFKGELKVPQSYIGPATLVLMKDNASGLPEHDAWISFPITVEY